MFEYFLENEQFNFQINRVAVYGPSCINLTEVRQELPKIKDIKSWTEVWGKLARKAEAEKRFGQAVYYYRMAEFYLEDTNPEKIICYQKFRECFDFAHQGESIERIQVPYQGTYLPVMRLKAPQKKGVLLIHGGYDSFIEEFYSLVSKYQSQGYTLILFEGPGQGQARKNGLTFSYDWEKPTSAVLDFLHLNYITLMGISWGGYLAPRAAAFDKRIQNVICYDIFYWGLDMMLNRMKKREGRCILVLLYLRQKKIVNLILQKKTADNIDLEWKLTHGMYITGTSSPYDFLKSINKHKLSHCLGKITQNILLLAGERDQYVPVRRIKKIQKMLCNANSVSSHVFTKEEGGKQHCQVGEIQLVQREIDKFLEAYASPHFRP